MAMHHVHRGTPFGMAVGLRQVGLRQVALNNKTVPVLHQRRRRENGPPDRFLTLLHP
jgi:hypothetical protein